MGVRNLGEMGQNLQKIIKRLLANQNLCKLLYYTDKDPLNGENIPDTTILYGKQITINPQYNPAEKDYSVVIPMIQHGRRGKNDEFTDILIRIYIYVPQTQWIIKSDNLRPYLILGELQNSLEDKNINGLGTINCSDFVLNMVSEQMTSYYIDFNITQFA